jgi:undecaprenyl-diphosphatase
MSEFLDAVGRLDFAAFQWLRTHHWAFLDPLMASASDLARGGGIWIGLALLIAFVHRSRWPAAVQVLLAVILTGLVTDHVAKPLFNRSRPFESYADTRVYGYKPTTRSLPSGHAAQAMAGAYALTRLAPDARAIFWVLGFLVAFSRVHLGVHYPADVIAGALLGIAVAIFVVGGTTWRTVSASRSERGG